MTSDSATPVLSGLIAQVANGTSLSRDEARTAITEVMDGRATPVQIAALLVGFKAKGLTASEVAGGVDALRSVMVPVLVNLPDELVDTCGTGGGLTTFNISTAAALCAAGVGVRIAKHGNRSFTSKSGSADVLEALGVTIDLTPVAMANVLKQAGIVFMFAPLLHPAMRHAGPVRRELGIPTIMNLLGPLTNPAGAVRQIVGVSDPAQLELVAATLFELGHRHSMVVHGQPGMDEISPLGRTRIVEIRDGVVTEREIAPRHHDIDREELAGADPQENARIIRDVLGGAGTRGAREAVVLNAGAAIYLSGISRTLEDGFTRAEQALDAGEGLSALDRLIHASAGAQRSDA